MKLIDRYLGLEWAKWFALSMFFLLRPFPSGSFRRSGFAHGVCLNKKVVERVGLVGIRPMGFACFLFCCDCDQPLFSFEESGIVSLAGFGFLFIRTSRPYLCLGRSCLCYAGKP